MEVFWSSTDTNTDTSNKKSALDVSKSAFKQSLGESNPCFQDENLAS